VTTGQQIVQTVTKCSMMLHDVICWFIWASPSDDACKQIKTFQPKI